MKKTGIVSVQNNNYGSILQAYALQRKLFDLNYDNEIISYKKDKILQFKRLLYFPLLKNLISNRLKIVKCKKNNKELYENVIVSRNKSFNNFKEKNLIFSKMYNGKKQLISASNKYENIIVGSDQVWHPINLGSKYYSLIFVPNKINKISYASSFGVSNIPKNQIKKTKEYLMRINHISVREESGAKIVKALTNRNIPVVLDPTLLLEKEKWDKIKNNKINYSNYILCYFIGKSEHNRKLARKFADDNNLKIIILPHIDEYVKEDEIIGDIFPENIGPGEFVSLIENAEYIFTDSFHASVFSIIYGKEFFVFERFSKNDKKSTNSRIYSLLNKLDISKRLCYNYEDIKKALSNKIDYSRVNMLLQKEKEKSLNYLIDSLKK